MIDLQTSVNGLMELMYGTEKPDLVFALRIAALSPLQDLLINGKMARLLAPFVGKPLPEQETLFALLKTSRGCIFATHIQALYSIDELWLSGKLRKFEILPDGYAAQKLWRDELVALINGMSYKTISFAALIYQPLSCELIPIDRHHLRRLGLDPKRTPHAKKYLALELALQAERDLAGYKNVALGTFGAMLWGQIRDGIDAAQYPSHQALSCR